MPSPAVLIRRIRDLEARIEKLEALHDTSIVPTHPYQFKSSDYVLCRMDDKGKAREAK